MMFRPLRCVFLAGFWLASGLCSPVDAGLLYDQEPTITSGYYNTLTSAYVDSNYNYFYTTDNFTLTTNATVTGFNWQGTYLGVNSSTGDLGNAAPNTSSWLIEIYDANYNPVGYQYISSADVTETLLGTTTINNSSGNNATINYYSESAQLANGFLLNANQTYYLGIFSVNDNPSSTDFWSWMSGSGGDGVSYQSDSYTGSNDQVSLDRTFSLSGSAVPEPSSLILTALGTACLVGYSRKKRTGRSD